MSNVILAIKARRFLKKGCEAFLALALDSKRGQIKLEDIPVVKEFSDVFPEELTGLPPDVMPLSLAMAGEGTPHRTRTS